MPETLLVGSAAGRLVAAMFLLAVSAGIGGGVFILLTRPRARRAEFHGLGALRPPTAGVLAGSLTLGLLAVTWWTVLAGFHRIDAEADRLRLRLLWPPFSVTLQRHEIEAVEASLAYRQAWRLRIRTTDGRTYESQTASRAEIESLLERLATPSQAAPLVPPFR